jgi:transposase-like protein
MSTRRTFSDKFKRHVVEEILNGGTTTAATCRKYAIAYPVIARWKKDYSLGMLVNEPPSDECYQEKIARLECKVGQLTMENDVLKSIKTNSVTASPKRTYISHHLPAFGSIRGVRSNEATQK